MGLNEAVTPTAGGWKLELVGVVDTPPHPDVPWWSALVYVLPPALVNPIYGFIIGHMPNKSVKNSLLRNHNKNEITHVRVLEPAGADLPIYPCGGERWTLCWVEVTWMLCTYSS